jgi:hypothetical protein
VEAAEDVVDVPALSLLEAPAGEVLCNRVQVLDDEVRVGRDHAVTDRLQRDLRALFLLEQGVLVELALRDVEFDADQSPQAPARIHARLGAAHDPAPLAVRVAHPVHALEHRDLARDMVADERLDARHVVPVHESPPVRGHVRVVLVVAEHLAPARREIDRVVLDVEVPEPVVRGWQRQVVALLEPAEVAVDAKSLEAGGETRPHQLQQQVQVRVPAVARLRRAQRHEAADATVQRKSTDQQGSDAEFRETRGVRRLFPAGRQRVPELDDPQVLEAVGQQRQALEGIPLHHLGVERGEQRRGTRHPLDDFLLGVEECDADRIHPRGLAKRLEVALDAAVAAFARERLEIDCDLGGEDVESDGRAIAVPEDNLGREEVRAVLLVAALGWGDAHLVRSDPFRFASVCQPGTPRSGTAAQF